MFLVTQHSNHPAQHYSKVVCQKIRLMMNPRLTVRLSIVCIGTNVSHLSVSTDKREGQVVVGEWVPST